MPIKEPTVLVYKKCLRKMKGDFVVEFAILLKKGRNTKRTGSATLFVSLLAVLRSRTVFTGMAPATKKEAFNFFLQICNNILSFSLEKFIYF